MPFWQDHTEVLLMVGLAAERPAAPEAKHHAYWALDTSVLYFSDNDLNWVQAGSISPLPLADGGLGADISSYEGLIKIHSGVAANIQCDFAKTTAPGASDDNTAGWGIFSLWYDTVTTTLYICTDASTGAAVWAEIGLTWAPADAHYWTSQAESGLSNEQNLGALAAGIVTHFSGMPGSIAPFLCQGRLSLESGIAESTADQDNKTTLYWVPQNGGWVRLWDGTSYHYLKPGELSISGSGLSINTLYDAFMDYNSGSPQLVFGTVWSSDTVRAVALSDYTDEDVQYYSSDDTYLYLGTVYVASNGGSPVFKDVGGGIDTPAQRYVWNRWNPVHRHMRFGLSVNSYTYATTSWRQVNADSNARFDFVIGLDRREVRATYNQMAHTGGIFSGIGLDSTAANATDTLIRGFGGGVTGNATVGGRPLYRGYPGIGKHSLNFLEKSSTGTATVLGDANIPNDLQSGGEGDFYG